MLAHFKFHLLASAMLIGLAALIACSPTATPMPSATPLPATVASTATTVATATPIPAALTIETLRNAGYSLPELGPIQLVDGAYEDKYGDGATQVNQVAFISAALGDLNADGLDDAAVILWMNTGGSGDFIYLAAMLNESGTPAQTDITMLGDRAQVQQSHIEAGVITLELLTHGPSDPMCCPSQRVTQTYQLLDGNLIQLSIEIHPTPTPETPAALTLDIIRNAAYRSEWPKEGVAKLDDGIYNEQIPISENSTAAIAVALYPDGYAFGDLNGDGAGDAAVILAASGGGSGTFITLEVLRNDNGAPHHVATVQLGDRTRIESIEIDAGLLTLRMLTHGPVDPACCPTVHATRAYQLQDEELILVSEDIDVGSHNDITDVRWYWIAFLDTAGENDIAVPNPENYWFELDADGQYHIQADCNQGSGAYTLNGFSITLEAGPMTRAACGPDSLDATYLERLSYVVTYVRMGDDLFLNLMADGGDMKFTARLAQPETLSEPPAFVDLPDGTRCAFAGHGATLAFDDKRLNYTCETDGEDEVGLIGDFQWTNEGWLAEKAIIGHDSSGFFLKESEMVIVRIVEEATQRTVDDPSVARRCPPPNASANSPRPDYQCDNTAAGATTPQSTTG
jgi:heat shock protein HslJ